MTTLRSLSRGEYGKNGDIPNRDELKLGALQRIADATEAMAHRHTELIRDRDRYENLYRQERARVELWKRSNAALRGQITKLRKKLALLAAEGETC